MQLKQQNVILNKKLNLWQLKYAEVLQLLKLKLELK